MKPNTTWWLIVKHTNIQSDSLYPWAMWLWESMEKPETFYTAHQQPETHKQLLTVKPMKTGRETGEEGQPQTSSSSSTILFNTSLSSLLWHISAVTTPEEYRKMCISVLCQWVYVSWQMSTCGVCLPLHPEHWMKKLMRSRRDGSLSLTYASIQSSITAWSNIPHHQ